MISSRMPFPQPHLRQLPRRGEVILPQGLADEASELMRSKGFPARAYARERLAAASMFSGARARARSNCSAASSSRPADSKTRPRLFRGSALPGKAFAWNQFDPNGHRVEIHVANWRDRVRGHPCPSLAPPTSRVQLGARIRSRKNCCLISTTSQVVLRHAVLPPAMPWKSSPELAHRPWAASSTV